MVNKREEERREDGNEGIKEGKRGKATQPSCDERNPWGGRRGKLRATEGKRGATEEEKNGAAKNGSELRYY